MEFNIGERVISKRYEDMPQAVKNGALCKCCGLHGTVVDKLYSEARGRYGYTVHFDGMERPSNVYWTEDLIEAEPLKVSYHFEFDITDSVNNVVICTMFQTVGDKTSEIGRGHGHVIHEGKLGIAQAASYALSRVYKRMEESANGKRQDKGHQ